MGRLYNLSKNIRIIFERLVNRIMFAYFGVIMEGKPGNIEGILTVRSTPKGRIEIGSDVQFRSGKNYNIIGGDTRLILRTYRDGQIIIGNRVGISNSALISINRIQIDDDVMIGASCKIWDSDFHSLKLNERKETYDKHIQSAPIHIKRGAFIGAETIILKGVTVGENSIIGAGSVLTKDIPNNEIWAGNPAKKIRAIDKEQEK